MRCRICSANLSDKDVLIFSNMPQSAQGFLKKSELDKDFGEDIHLKQCKYCGLVQAYGEPVSYYRDVIRASGVSTQMRRFRIDQYTDWVGRCGLQGKKIIEIGCGRGEYLDFMEETDAMVFGMEHDPSSVKEAIQAGHHVFEGFIEDDNYVIPEAPYARFFMMNFLEHIPEPVGFLRAISDNLESEAYGLIEVPDFSMMIARSLYSEFIQDHLSYFTEDTFGQLLRLCGFDVLSVKSIWNGYILSAEIKKKTPLDVSGFKNEHINQRSLMKNFFDREKQKGSRLAVWGAGHQALANLSLLAMSKDIVCVIDSADFKQGMYTPVTHIPIVSPEDMYQYKIDKVIIMAAGYSDEVAGIMESSYPNIEKVIFDENGFR